jgi:hypothetical protein
MIRAALRVLLFLSPWAAFAVSSSEFVFMWDEANAKTASAATPRDFLAAADTYRQIAARGVRNGFLFYNMGLALLKAERFDEARHALLRAERYAGSNPDIRHNLQIAMAGRNRDRTVSLPWYRVPLFWHYELAARTRMSVGVFAFTVFWLSLAGFCFQPTREAARAGMALSIVVLVLFGSSLAVTFHQESADEGREALVAGLADRPGTPLRGREDGPEHASAGARPAAGAPP